MAKIVSTADIDTNQQIGVVILRNCINSDWISQLQVAVEEDLASSGPRAEI
ncbi:MAG: hypothetical protein VCB06_03375 [Alphaproteobacteria bacterium]